MRPIEVKRMAPRTAIVTTLKKHGSANVDFLANEIGRKPSEVEGYVQGLANAGVVSRRNGTVSLANASK